MPANNNSTVAGGGRWQEYFDYSPRDSGEERVVGAKEICAILAARAILGYEIDPLAI